MAAEPAEPQGLLESETELEDKVSCNATAGLRLLCLPACATAALFPASFSCGACLPVRLEFSCSVWLHTICATAWC